MKRIALCILSLAGCALAQVRVPAGRILGLTQEISPTSPVFFSTMAFSAQQDTEEAKLHIYCRTFKASEHIVTHVDAPSHFSCHKNLQMVNELTLRQVAQQAIVVDI